MDNTNEEKQQVHKCGACKWLKGLQCERPDGTGNKKGSVDVRWCDQFEPHTCSECHYYGDNGWCYYCEDITPPNEPACKVWEPRIKL